MKDKRLSKQSWFFLAFNIPMRFETGRIWIRLFMPWTIQIICTCILATTRYIMTVVISATVSHDIGCTPPTYSSALVQLVYDTTHLTKRDAAD